jgi:transcriptional regulator with GAF, ATPase, and Fis domain
MPQGRTILALLLLLAGAHLGVLLAAGAGVVDWAGAAVAVAASAWVVVAATGIVAVRRIARLEREADRQRETHRLTLQQMAQLETQNEILQVVTRAPDVGLAFQALARRIADIVPCDRLGLALLKEGSQFFQTYTALVGGQERRQRPRLEIEFSVDGTIIGTVVRSRAPRVVEDNAAVAAEYLDANVLHTAGFRSALVVPLLSKGRAVGTLNAVSRARGAFTEAQAALLTPIAEILAVAHVAQQAQLALARYRATEAMMEVTLGIANEIASTVQTIVGRCGLLERTATDPALQRDIGIIVEQSHRIAGLLDRMRAAAHERLEQSAVSASATGIPTSPEALEN